jgi:tryptophanyl-tRNA synthetase
MMRILSGVQPSGRLHLGNYFGAVRNHVQLQHEGEAFYFIADLHALTTVQDPAKMRDFTRGVALDYLAFGLDPQKAVFFRQSDVPEVPELTWLLGTVTGMGLLERCHSYKDKTAKGLKPSFGLFAYPVLMAADILIYRSDLVPVGKDQLQHIEVAQDIAQSFNAIYGPVLKRPEPRLSAVPIVPGTDGRKMSKSYGNTIPLDAEGKELRKAVMGIQTDSTPVEAPKNPETCHVYSLYSLFADDAERAALAGRYRAGGLGYGEAKKMLLEKIETAFADYRVRRKVLLKNLDYVEEALKRGAERARAAAAETLRDAKRAVGLSQ